MAHSSDKKWQNIRNLETLLALLNSIEDHRAVIEAQAFNEGSWDAAYDEAVAMEQELARLRRHLAARWEELFSETKERS